MRYDIFDLTTLNEFFFLSESLCNTTIWHETPKSDLHKLQVASSDGRTRARLCASIFSERKLHVISGN